MDVGALQTYFGLSASALFIYDYAITFQREVELDWTSEWNCVRVLFILIRYTPFASVPLHLFYLLSENISTKTCAAVFIASRWLLAVGIVSAEMVLLVRTWVLWNRRKSLLAVLVAGGTCIFAATIYGVWTRSLEDRHDAFQRRPRCQVLTGTPFVAVCIVAVMAFETVVLALTLVNLLQQLRQMGRSFFRFSLLLRVLYRDGIIFFIYLFIISLVNLIFVLTGPAIMNDLLIPLQHTLHSATTARVLLNLREAALARRSGIAETSLIAFNEDPVCADPPV